MPARTPDRNASAVAGRLRRWPAARQAIGRGRRGRSSHGPLERITVNVTGRASRALDLASRLTGDTKTDTVNRALQIYAYLEQVTANGGSVYVRGDADSELEPLTVL